MPAKPSEAGNLTEADFTAEFCRELVTQHGDIRAAARAIAPQCWSQRYDRSAHWRTVRTWISKRVGPRRTTISSDRDDRVPGDGKDMAQPARVDQLNRIAELIERAGVPIDSIGRIRNVKLRSWGVHAKLKTQKRDVDGKPMFTANGKPIMEEKFVKDGLYATNITLDPTWKEGPQWPVIQQPAPRSIQYIPLDERGGDGRVRTVGFRKVLIIGDIQAGYWILRSGELEPFHDVAAIKAVLAFIAWYRPDEIIFVGDVLDAAEFSRYLQLPEFQRTFQPSIDYVYRLLCTIRSAVGPHVKIVWIEGNHERRVPEMIIKNAAAAHGIRRAECPDSWPVMSIPHLCRLDELGVEYLKGYPGNQYWITKGLVVQHQDPAKKEDLRASIIYGHQETIKVNARTVHYRDGAEMYCTYCVPGVTRIEDSLVDVDRLCPTPVPSARQRRNVQQAIATVDVFADDVFSVQIAPIIRGELRYPGGLFTGTAA